MIDDIKKQSEGKMKKALEALANAFARIRTGRAHPSILDSVMVSYYGTDTPITQVAKVHTEDARTLAVTPWEKNLTPLIEKAIHKSNLGLNPSTSGEIIRVPMPALTEETRKDMVKLAKNEAESARVSIRSARRDANADIKDLTKEKEISEDEEKKALDEIQKLTDKYIARVEEDFNAKEKDLMVV